MRSVGLLLIAAVVAGVGCRQPEPTAPDVHLRLEPYFRDLRTVRVVAGQDTLHLLLDTGGGMTLVTPDVAERHGCSPFGRDIGHRMSGERVAFMRCDSLTLGAAAWSHRFAPIAVYDVNALLPPVLPRLDGVLALDAFVGELLVLDLASDRVTLHRRPADSVARLALPVRIATGMSGGERTAMVRVTGRRGPLWFLLDSGNLAGTRVASWVLQDSLLPLPAPDTVALVLEDGTLHLPFTSADLSIDGALGTDFFRRGPVVLDLRRVP